MSSIISKVFGVIGAMTLRDTKYVLEYNPLKIGTVAAGVFGHMTYAYGTKKEDTITVKNKYNIYSTGMTSFLIDDKNNKQYNIPYSLWYWQFDVPEKWNKMETGKQYKVKQYGYRVPALGIYPNIINVEEV